MGKLMTVGWKKERDEKGMKEEGEREIKVGRGQWRGSEIRIFPLFLTGHLVTQYFIQRIPEAVIKYHLPFMFLSMFRSLPGHRRGDILKK
jgi:hypothetical protein